MAGISEHRDLNYFQLLEQVLTPQVASDTVWHYTSAAGALSIIENRQLWASSAVTLNDSAEILHGLGLIDQYLADRPSERHVEKIIGWVSDARAKLDAFDLADSYVLCASLDGESQTQFALYGKYAIGLNSGMGLTKEVAAAGVVPMEAAFRFGWRRVLYEDDAKNEQIAVLVGVLQELAARQQRFPDMPDTPDIYRTEINFIVQVAAHLKHKRFAHEQEVRLYGRGEPTGARVFFRTRGDVVVPYLKIQADGDGRGGNRLPLRGVNLGPGLDFSMAEIGIRTVLRLNGYEYSPIDVRNVAGTRR